MMQRNKPRQSVEHGGFAAATASDGALEESRIRRDQFDRQVADESDRGRGSVRSDVNNRVGGEDGVESVVKDPGPPVDETESRE